MIAHLSDSRTARPGRAASHRGARWKMGALAVCFSALVACDDSPTDPGSDQGTWIQVEAGNAHACALTDQGRVYCWGSNSEGQAGVPGTDPVLRPTLVQTEQRFERIAAGGDNSCAMTAQGALFCWGTNEMGQLGNGGISNALLPVPVDGGANWTSVSVGPHHACALDTAGEVHCWGGDRWDVALGFRGPATCDAPAFEARWPCVGVPRSSEKGTGYAWVEAGLYRTCAGRTGESAVCWGTNSLGQLGTASTGECANNDPLHPLTDPCSRDAVSPQGPTLAFLSPGPTHGCGVDTQGSAHCWGALLLNFGQLGNGSTDGAETPVAVSGLGTVRTVMVSNENHIRTFSCAIDTGDQAHCWGANRWGQLGATSADTCQQGGDLPCSLTPIPLETSSSFADMDLGTEFACGLTNDAQVLCWGFNDMAQLGDGTTTSRQTPSSILEP